MKKLSALLLSMVMTASLAVPAFADGADGPAPDDYDYGDAVPISAPIDDDIYGWTVEDEWEYVCEEYPEEVAVFQKEVKTWFAQHADWYDADTFDEFVENVGGEEAAYVSLFYDWNMERVEKQARDVLIKALGGVPGQVNVRINNEFIKFPDAAPEIANGRTMAPLRAIMEALGAEVVYNGNDDIRCTVNGVQYTFAVGSNAVNLRYVSYDGEGDAPDMEGIEMDCAPYIKGGRTYVPVRFFAEALGYEVGWDSEYQTAILLDREALAAEIDKDFTILNRVVAANTLSLENGRAYSAEVKGNVTVTAFDTLDGNKTYKADLTGKTLMNAEAINGTYSVALSRETVDGLMAMLIGENWAEVGEDADTLRAVLEGLSMDIIMTKEGMMLVHAPVVDELSGEKNLWYQYSMDVELVQAIFTGTGTATVGTVLAGLVPADSLVMFSEGNSAVMLLAEFYSDEKFTTSGGVSTLTIGLDELADHYTGGSANMKEAYKEYNFTMKVDEKGGATVTCVAETNAQYGTPAMRMTLDYSQSGGKTNMTLNIHMANAYEMALTLTSQLQAASETPEAEPPAGANITSMENLMGEGYSNGW